MRLVIVMVMGLILGCQNDNQIQPIDLCPTCLSVIEVNGKEWPSKPAKAYYHNSSGTTFTLSIHEVQPTEDSFSDALRFRGLPFEIGTYEITDSLKLARGTDSYLLVFETEYGTPHQEYNPLYDGSSKIIINNANPITNEFSLTFNLLLYPNGNPNGPIGNSTYPAMINFIGEAEGYVVYQ